MTKLWIPGEGMEFDDYQEATQEQLNALWKEYSGREAIAVPQAALGEYHLLGSLSAPERPVRGYASIDVCEVLRESYYSLMRLVGPEEDVYKGNPHDYKGGLGTTQETVRHYLQVLINNNLATPTEGIEEIGDIMRNWRDQGVYVVANTSTFSSCEPGTVDFLAKYLPGAFDGILFPRNHNGDPGVMNKGLAARAVVQTFPPVGESFAAVHIDDSPTHNSMFRDDVEAFPGAQVGTFQPQYELSHFALDARSVISPSPLESFRAADEFLAAQLGPAPTN